ncbi:MAG: site-2 protease family protein [Nitrospirota bacterium]
MLFKLLGFEVRLDLSWLILAILITWSLAQGLFPSYYKNLPAGIYWWMGAAGALGLFVSIVFHEFFHSVVARQFGIPMKGITLFVFGGVAEMEDEPPSAKAEFLMAIAGPASSIIIGFIFYLIYLFGKGEGWPIPVLGVLSYLGLINWVLAGFNMLPAFPLDGGRVLRSALWKWKKKLRWATRIASQIGSSFGLLLIILGIASVLTGNLIGGLWWFIIGIFLRNASQMSYKQVLIRRALEGEKVERFMKRNPVTVTASLSLDQLVEDYIYKYHFKMLPVVEEGKIAGCITTRHLKEIPREHWAGRKVGDVMSPRSDRNTISPEMDAIKALSLMNQTWNSRLMVADGHRLVGIITLKDIMRFLSVKMDLDESE